MRDTVGLREVARTVLPDVDWSAAEIVIGEFHDVVLAVGVAVVKVARGGAVRRVERALALPPVEPVLVHGDLAGTNVLWRADSTVCGVLDWDLAQAFDPAVDVACLSWFGWDRVEAAVDAEQLHRARVWADTFALEQVAAALDNGEPEPVVQQVVDRVVEHLST